MGFDCKGKCKNKAVKKFGSSYKYGLKRCSICCEFLHVKSTHCFCCGVMLRVKPQAKIENKEMHNHQAIGIKRL